MSDDEDWYYDHASRLEKVSPGLDANNFAMGCHYNGHEELLRGTTRIHHAWTDGTDEPMFAWIIETDAGFWFVSGGHDYTGWDCQSSLDIHQFDTLRQAINGAGDDLRRIWSESPSSSLGESGSGEP